MFSGSANLLRTKIRLFRTKKLVRGGPKNWYFPKLVQDQKTGSKKLVFWYFGILVWILVLGHCNKLCYHSYVARAHARYT